MNGRISELTQRRTQERLKSKTFTDTELRSTLTVAVRRATNEQQRKKKAQVQIQ